MRNPFQVPFENGTVAQGISLSQEADIPTALQQLGIATARPTLVIIGGASGLSDDEMEKLRSLFQDVLCPFASSLNFAVVDGGTDAGVMRLIGQARVATGCDFPLLGVVVKAKVIMPDQPPPAEDAATLESHHTHFILVPGDHWGDESEWIAEVATVLAAGNPSLTLLINGGAIALNQDVPNSIGHDRPVLIIGGSGRSADRLANAVTGKTTDPDVQTLVNSGLLYTVDLSQDAQMLNTALREVFTTAHALAT